MHESLKCAIVHQAKSNPHLLGALMGRRTPAAACCFARPNPACNVYGVTVVGLGRSVCTDKARHTEAHKCQSAPRIKHLRIF
eukprot:124138-Pelagomonas_calceolata.AAC.4